jgi:hypothetical protein
VPQIAQPLQLINGAVVALETILPHFRSEVRSITPFCMLFARNECLSLLTPNVLFDWQFMQHDPMIAAGN